MAPLPPNWISVKAGSRFDRVMRRRRAMMGVMAKQPTKLVLPPRKPAAPPPVVYTKETVPDLAEDPQPDMSDGRAYAEWCMRQRLRKERGFHKPSESYTIDTVPSIEDDPMPSRGAGYGAWCCRQNLRRMQRDKYGPEFLRGGGLERSRRILVEHTITYLYSLSERKLADAFGALHGEMDREAWDAWMEHHPELKRLIGTRG